MNLTDPYGGGLLFNPLPLNAGFPPSSGVDGNVTISSPTSLAQEPAYDVLTVNDVLSVVGWPVFAKTRIIIGSTGVINARGTAGSGATKGTAPSGNQVLGIGADGGNGGATTGTAGSAITSGLLGLSPSGGGGGAGSGGAGGAAGSFTAIGVGFGRIEHFPQAWLGAGATGGGFQRINGGVGGGGGGGDGTNPGGGGGGGGGIIVVCAPEIVISTGGLISADGGAGASAAAMTGSNLGGGGGGMGGVVVLIYRRLLGDTSGITANGGVGGAKKGTGVAGTAGANGRVIFLQA